MVMRQLVAMILISALSAPAFAGPLAESAARHAAQPVPQRADAGGGLIWGGLALLGAGLTMEILSFTAAKQRDAACVVGFSGFVCLEETRTNKGLLFTGLAIGVTGGVLMNFGFDKRRRAAAPSIQITPSGVTVQHALRF